MSESYHVGRSWTGTQLEDDCPCPKAPCGLALINGLMPDLECPQHSLRAAKTIRQFHSEDNCPGEKMTEQYTPITDEVAEVWLSRYDGEHTSASRAEFDRWLNKVKTEVRSETLRTIAIDTCIHCGDLVINQDGRYWTHYRGPGSTLNRCQHTVPYGYDAEPAHNGQYFINENKEN